MERGDTERLDLEQRHAAADAAYHRAAGDLSTTSKALATLRRERDGIAGELADFDARKEAQWRAKTEEAARRRQEERRRERDAACEQLAEAQREAKLLNDEIISIAARLGRIDRLGTEARSLAIAYVEGMEAKMWFGSKHLLTAADVEAALRNAINGLGEPNLGDLVAGEASSTRRILKNANVSEAA